ncbi:hypothetical protein Acr_00g0041320 [Actinidia rufa]|uniref:Uncharacterized protein n=1 Tax=Actinidia rufa TaxID=165716 RepID=A0A7J0DJ45_9ERIC|nr:hypothetical protein Acr_00g0041320 [Actinidia rufa]
MSPHQARGRARSLTGARGAHVAHGARGDRDKGDNDNHHESVMGGGAHAFGGNVWVVGGAPPMVISGTEFMQGVFTTIEQVVRNTVQEMLVPARAADTRVTIREDLNETRWITHPKSQREGTSAQPEGHFSKETEKFYVIGPDISERADLFWLSPIWTSCCRLPTEGSEEVVETGGILPRAGAGAVTTSGPQALGQKGQRTRGRTYAMTSVVGPSETTGQQEQQLDASVVRGTLYTFKFVGLVDW